jgi:hypothetical protein
VHYAHKAAMQGISFDREHRITQYIRLHQLYNTNSVDGILSLAVFFIIGMLVEAELKQRLRGK